jgi:intermembrane space import and assembly protein 40
MDAAAAGADGVADGVAATGAAAAAAVKQDEKDTVIFVTPEDEAPSSGDESSGDESEGEVEEDARMGAVGPDGEIDWDCPCLAGMTKGPCGESFKGAFGCFVHSTDEPKGSDCMEEFKKMHECLVENAEYYDQSDDESSDEEGGEGAAAAGGSSDDETAPAAAPAAAEETKDAKAAVGA